VEAWKALGLAQLGLNHYADAAGPLRKACAGGAAGDDACYLVGRTLSVLARYDEAQEPLHRALLAASADQLSKVNRAIAINMEQLGKAAEAERYFRAAIHEYRASSREDPHLDYGRFLVRQGRAAEALPVLQQALFASPNSATTNAETGRALLDLERAAQSLPYLEKALTLQPAEWKVRMLLGKAYLRAGRAAEGERELRKAREDYARANAGSSTVQ